MNRSERFRVIREIAMNPGTPGEGVAAMEALRKIDPVEEAYVIANEENRELAEIFAQELRKKDTIQ
jgi:hypothetical protein